MARNDGLDCIRELLSLEPTRDPDAPRKPRAPRMPTLPRDMAWAFLFVYDHGRGRVVHGNLVDPGAPEPPDKGCGCWSTPDGHSMQVVEHRNLAALTRKGLIARRNVSTDPTRDEYEVTDKGRAVALRIHEWLMGKE